MMPRPGERFGAYEVEAPIGQGGMGVVFRARDATLGRTVALKVLLPDALGDDEAVARFLREARLAASLDHPGIVAIYGVGTVSATPYIAMEWLDGRTLLAVLRDPSALGEERRLDLLVAIAEIVAFAHARGVVHRDLKPSNVMIDRHGRPKLLDFGIAKRITPGPQTFATRDGSVLGTPRYMAPEQELTSHVDARADQYAWGVMAYELLSGERPSRPAVPSPKLPPAMALVVMRALAPLPNDRFASMDDLLSALRPAAPPRALPRAPAAAPRPPRRALLFFASLLSVFAAGLLAALAALDRSPFASDVLDAAAPAPAPVVSTVPPVQASIPVDAASEPAEADAPFAADAAEGGADAARARQRRPGRTVSAMNAIVKAARNLEPGEVERELAKMRPALARCILGVRLLEEEIVVRADVDGEGRVSRTSVRQAYVFSSEDPHAPQLWPPEPADRCIRSVVRGARLSTVLDESASFQIDIAVR